GGAQVQFTLPPESGMEPIAVEPVESRGRVVAALPEASWPGFYGVEQPGGEAMTLAVNIDPAESDVHALSTAELRQAINTPAVRVFEPGDNVASAVQELRVGYELW